MYLMRSKRLSSRLGWPVTLVWLLALALLLSGASCTEQNAKTAADVAVRVADGVCKEEANQPAEPEWVAIACAIESAAGGVAHVVMPRAQWDVVRGKKPPPCSPAKPPTFDAGPGK